MIFLRKLLLLLLVITPVIANAQEYSLPLQQNDEVYERSKVKDQTAQRPTLIALPFFEDFTDYDPYPNTGRWSDNYVYINNTMGRNPVSRGVATFDALNAKGAVYYDTITPYTLIYADTLTSRAIGLGSNQPSDSVYLSFFYQRKGFGFSPKPGDSLMLYLLKSNGVWEKAWALQGDTGIAPFRQVMVPVTDPDFFHDNFQMRWINKATIGVSNSHWNLDYIRLDEGRGQSDTALRDIAFTQDPASILNDFTAMPFRHFKTNPASFVSGNLTASLRNNGNASPNTPVGYRAREVATNTTIGSGSSNTSMPPYGNGTASFPMYNAGAFNPANPNGKVVYENTFYCNSNYPNESKANDTIVSNQVFDNYFAYDDGTAEQAYFLNLLPNAPGYTAVEYALYAPDTIRGVAIRFARTLPNAELKEFSLAVYKDIAVNGGSDVLLHQENFLYPTYEDTINKFSIYTFSEAIGLGPGVYYVGVIQPAGGTSDSLQIALDANRLFGNHRYFKVETNWEPSLLEGALMLRPLVGSSIQMGIKEQNKTGLQWNISPNPAMNQVTLHIAELKNKKATYSVVDVQGKLMMQGTATDNAALDISKLASGVYFISINSAGDYTRPVKILKL